MYVWMWVHNLSTPTQIWTIEKKDEVFEFHGLKVGLTCNFYAKHQLRPANKKERGVFQVTTIKHSHEAHHRVVAKRRSSPSLYQESLAADPS